MTFRVVVVGTGFGSFVVAPAYEAFGCEVSVVSPRDAGSVRDAIAAPCDLVSVHSAPFLHLDNVRVAIEHGRAVLCDKPFGRDVGEAREMLRLAEAAGVQHFLNFEFRRDPLRVRLRSLLEAGAIGAPTHVSWTAFVSSGRKLRHRWLFDAGKGGWIGAFGSHAVDALRWLFGEIVEAGAQVRTDVKRRRDRDRTSDRVHDCTAEDAFTAWFRTAGGLTATLDTGYAMAVDFPSRLVIFGEGGAIEVGHIDLTLRRVGEDPVVETFPPDLSDPHQPALGLWLADVVEAVNSKRRITPDFRDGVACVEILDRLRAAGGVSATPHDLRRPLPHAAGYAGST